MIPVLRFAALPMGLVLLAAVPVRPQSPPEWQSAVKFLCGRSQGLVVAPGVYYTAINIHNPSERPTAFRFKIAPALGLDGLVEATPSIEAKLSPDQATELDCPAILRRVAGKYEFLKGFVVVQSTARLDVVAVYSAAGSSGRIETLDVEYIVASQSTDCRGPDLIVQSIADPVWDSANQRSVIQAIIKNIGVVASADSLARVVDPSTPQPTGAPYNAEAKVPPLAPGASFTATFYLPYWVFNPDATLEVTADYKREIEECREDNNTRTYSKLG